MSQNVPFTPVEQRHWHIWTQLKESGYKDLEIATVLHRTKRTITRLKKKAHLNGEYAKWMLQFLAQSHQEFWELHKIVKKSDPVIAYQEIGRKIERSLTQHVHATSTETIHKQVSIDLNVFTDDEKTILDRAARVLDRKSKRESSNIH